MQWSEVPDRVGVVLACRAWRWRPPSEAPGGPLRSIAKGTDWPALRRLEAACIEPLQPWTAWGGVGVRRPVSPHQAPHIDCECGIWGLGSPEILLHQHPSQDYVYGTVALWGAVVVGQRGWRAQYAYPQALVRAALPEPATVWLRALRGAELSRVGPPPLEELAATYGVPVVDDWPRLTPTPTPNRRGSEISGA
ncbi:MAG TPA: hypothetical protein VNO79_02660 [Actinomycetota bacterium]|nr:hypothetical protein [Actinomycetota bacterium]